MNALWHCRVARPVLDALVASWLCLAAGAGSASAAEEPPAPRVSTSSGDFLTHRPRGAIGVRGGWSYAHAGSDLFAFFESRLSVARSDFDAIPLGVEVAVMVSRRVQLQFGLDKSKSSVSSEYRDWVDDHGQPITQETSLSKTGVTGSVRYALLPRGVQLGRLAWVPRRVAPYVGAGAGMLHYDLEQSGDFVDFSDLGVFSDSFSSKGWAPTAQVFGGVDVRIYRMLFVSFEGRYTWAADELSSDFVGFDPIDLSGFFASVGVSWVF